MPTPQEIAAEAESLTEFFEQRWNLPWYSDRASSPIWRHPYLHLLAHLPSSLFADTMGILLRSRSFALRGIALHIVRMRDAGDFLPDVRVLLEDPSIHVRALAAAALGQIGDQEDLETLIQTRDGEHAEVKKAVVDALRRIRDVRCVPLLARWVGRAGEDDELRVKACTALGEIGDEAGIPVLARVLQDTSVADEVRAEAARSVGSIGGSEARRLLLGGLIGDRPWVRASCAQGLSALGGQDAVEALIPLLGADQPWMVRASAVETLGRTGGESALPHITPLTRDPEARIRGETCVALGLIGTPEARDLLRALLSDEELPVRIQALDAFTRITGEDFGFRLEDHTGSLDPKALDAALVRARSWVAG